MEARAGVGKPRSAEGPGAAPRALEGFALHELGLMAQPLPSSLGQCHHHRATAVITAPPSSSCHRYHHCATATVTMTLLSLPCHCCATAARPPPSSLHYCHHHQATATAVIIVPLSFLESHLPPHLGGKSYPSTLSRMCSLWQQLIASWGEHSWHRWASWEELCCEKRHQSQISLLEIQWDESPCGS